MRRMTASSRSAMMAGPCSSSVAVTRAVKPEMSASTKKPCFVFISTFPSYLKHHGGRA